MYTVILVVLNTAALLLGFAAWVLPILGRRKGRSLAAASWCCCALSAWIPSICTDIFVRVGDTSTLLDVAEAYPTAVVFLMAGTILSNLMFHRRQPRTAVE